MDDLVSKLQEILGSEEGMQKLKSVAGMLGMGELSNVENSSEKKQEDSAENGVDLSALSGLIDQIGKPDQKEEMKGKISDFGGIDIGTILRLQQVMSAFHNEDDNTRFLQALRPLMREERRHKVDEVLKLMKLFSLLPLLKETGILESFFGNRK